MLVAAIQSHDTPPPEDEPLSRSNNQSRDETPEHRRTHGIDSIYDEIGKISSNREADQDRNRPDPESTCTRSLFSLCHWLNGVSHIGFLSKFAE
jgi:hypothetical protein